MRITLNNIDDVYKAKQATEETMALKGYELIEVLFVDSSGLGQEDEPALTKNQFETRLKILLSRYPELTVKILDTGMFQVNLGVFKKIGKSKVKTISTNVLERQEEGARVIRLYNTDILKIKGNEYQLFNGGFETATTKKWLNKFLPFGIGVYQKNWEWFIQDYRNGWDNVKTIPFEEGIKITI